LKGSIDPYHYQLNEYVA